MIPIEYYSLSYYTVLYFFIVLFSIGFLTINKTTQYPKINKQIGLLIILTVTILFIGFRDPYGEDKYLGDTWLYTNMYENLYSTDVGYLYFMRLSSQVFSLNITNYYLLCAFIYVYFQYKSLKIILKDNAFFAFLIFVTAMSFWSFGINGLRTGLATSLFFLGISLNKKVYKILLLVVSITLHKSLLIPVIIYFFISRFFSFNKAFIVWILCLCFSLTLGSIFNDFILNYFSIEEESANYESYLINGSATFRYDFVFYSFIPIYLGRYYVSKVNINDLFYNRILNSYILVNGFWLLLMYTNYTNRIAYLSWFLIPLVLVYPLLKYPDKFKNQSLFYLLILLSNMIFTIFIFIREFLRY
ncbi:EpsG family protein [Empedobacter sp.]|uniref:EpsG family protein n=1 Tax=Empedobacter sp. TaxID=1927715 RepID=UPI00289E052D|nr:EpsG family protein [Empedobacter sp.]